MMKRKKELGPIVVRTYQRPKDMERDVTALARDGYRIVTQSGEFPTTRKISRRVGVAVTFEKSPSSSAGHEDGTGDD
jgi:hypothetical protein